MSLMFVSQQLLLMTLPLACRFSCLYMSAPVPVGRLEIINYMPDYLVMKLKNIRLKNKRIFGVRNRMIKYFDLLFLKNFKFTKKILNTCNKTVISRGLKDSLIKKLISFER
jgi:hypothetical protein